MEVIVAEPLHQIADHLLVMLASATELHDGIGDVVGYQIKTGALHRILGVLSGAGHPVSIPAIPNKSVSLPDGRITVAHVTTTPAGWAQLWMHGVILRSAYGQHGKEELDQQAAKVNAAAGVPPSPVPDPWRALAERASSLDAIYRNRNMGTETFRLTIENIAEDARKLLADGVEGRKR